MNLISPKSLIEKISNFKYCYVFFKKESDSTPQSITKWADKKADNLFEIITDSGSSEEEIAYAENLAISLGIDEEKAVICFKDGSMHKFKINNFTEKSMDKFFNHLSI